MTIFDLPGLDPIVAKDAIQKTLAEHSRLLEIYDEEFAERLVRRRRGQNHLLFMLVQPESEVTNEFWSSVVDDLEVLEQSGSFVHFKAKLRARDYETLAAGRSELALAARLKRQGFEVDLEEPTRNGKDCDFLVATEPTTYWEMKTIKDLDAVIEDEQVSFEVQARLRRIEEPYVLAILRSRIARADVPAAAREIKRRISAHYRDQGSLPAQFEHLGLLVEATTQTKQPQGYIGITYFGGRIFGSEHARKIRARIVSAIEQLPDEQAGVVVIDTTVSSWVDQHDVIDACFGVESLAFVNGDVIPVRDSEAAAFLPGRRTRVSAVVHYTRHPRGRDARMLIIHNPFANIPLSLDRLAADDVQQVQRVERERGYQLVRVPPDPEA